MQCYDIIKTCLYDVAVLECEALAACFHVVRELLGTRILFLYAPRDLFGCPRISTIRREKWRLT